MQTSADDVSRLQGRYSLTLLTPSSKYFSLFLSMGMAAAVAAAASWWYLDAQEYWRIVAVGAVLAATQLVDTLYIRNREYSKSLHSSAFGCCLWMLALLMGVVVAIITASETSPFFIALGMFLLASFRISIYTTVLGCRIGRAWATCFVQPAAVFAVMVPVHMWWGMLADPVLLAYAAAYLGCATAWSVLTDRSGRPHIKSAHAMVQAYIDSQGGREHVIESIMEDNASESRVLTTLVRFGGPDGFWVVLPEVHPGPYHPVGGSNIPYLIFEKMKSRAMVMHAISNHALNIPSQEQVERYIKSLEGAAPRESGSTCTEPAVVSRGKARVTGISVGDSSMLFMSLSPHGMEDLPNSVKSEIDAHAKRAGLGRVMLVDCHNAMGPEISGEDYSDMLRASRECLDELAGAKQYPLAIGYANSAGAGIRSDDLGLGGLGLLCLAVNGSRYYIGWADANNMKNGSRERVVAEFTKTGRTLLDICTSDTHYAPVKAKNRNGYYELGLMSGDDRLAEWFLGLAGKADGRVEQSKFEISDVDTDLLLMGSRVFENYSRAMDRSMNLVKIFMIGCAALFFSTVLV